MLKLAVCGTLVVFSSMGFAKAIHCKPSPEKVTSLESRLYRFTLSQKCEIEKNVDFENLKSGMKDDLQKYGKMNRSTDQVIYEGMPGFKLEYAENKVDTGHGTIAIDYDVYLVGDERRTLLSATSTDIDATSHADNTKKVVLKIDYTTTDTGTALVITKEVDVKRPHIAPEGIFRRKTIEGINNDLNRMISRQNSIVEEL